MVIQGLTLVCEVNLGRVPQLAESSSLHFAPVLSRYVIALLLGFGGFGKLLNLAEFRKVLAAYDVLPRRATSHFSYLLPVLELVTGTALFVRLDTPVPELFAAGLFATFGLGVAVNLLRGRRSFPCGCFGRDSEVLSWHIALRSLAMIGLALFASGRATTGCLPLLCPYPLSAFLEASRARALRVRHAALRESSTSDGMSRMEHSSKAHASGTV